ncbi:MAG: extracellular solute-binding protein [Candidatus Merdivicinus sp.]|jgi:putative aldouronate transport system substrate-binding protein
MRASRKKLLGFFAAALLLSGCTAEVPENDQKDQNENTPFSYPMDTDVTLTFFTAPVQGMYDSYMDTTWYQNVEKATGIHVEYIHPAEGEEDQHLRKLMASKDLPDLIRYDWINYPGGPDKAISDQVILRLNSILPMYSPNVWEIFQENPEWNKHYTSDTNQYFEYPLVYTNQETAINWGPIIRRDWLEELSLPIPVTVDDWTEMLRAFKEEKGAAAPLTFYGYPPGIMEYGFLSGAYGVTTDYYQEDGEIKYGFIEPGFKDFLYTLRSWYAEGLIDPNIASMDRDAVRYQMLSGESGAILGTALQDIPYLMENRNSSSFDLVGVTYPVLEEGQKPKFGQGGLGYDDESSVAISASCRHVEEAARYMDFAYTEQGSLINTYGKEGEDYRIQDGKAEFIFRPDILSDPYDMRVNWQFPGVKSHYWEGISEYGQFPQQEEALASFSYTDYQLYLLPSLSFETHESGELEAISSKIQEYTNEMYLKFMFGDIPVEQFDDYVDTVKNMGIERVIAAKEEALQRYRER